jgi:hypothetical protein
MPPSRPQSAHTFSAREYEEAKRRVRRLDAASGGSGGVVGRADATPLNGKKVQLQGPKGDVGGASTKTEKEKHRLRAADGDFVAKLQGNIAELRECIIGRLDPYPALQVSKKSMGNL